MSPILADFKKHIDEISQEQIEVDVRKLYKIY